MRKSQHTDEFAIFCELLRERRRKANLTQVELADKLEVTQSMLSKMERGELRLDVVQVQAFCLAMECSFVGLIKEFDERVREL